MPLRPPRVLLGNPSAGIAPSRILPCTCTTRYGEVPGDDDVLARVPESFGIQPGWLPWFLAGQQDTPAGTVWTVFVCPPLDPETSRNLLPGREAGPEGGPEFVLPEALWAHHLLSSGTAPTRLLRSPRGTWCSRWSEGRPTELRGPFPEDAPALRRVEGEPEIVAWNEPDQDALRALADEHPEAQMLSPSEGVRRRERLATRVSLARTALVALVAGFVALVAQAPHWVALRKLSVTEQRLASIRPEIDRLDRLREGLSRDAAYLESSKAALAPSASPLPLLAGVAHHLPSGVRLRSFQLESPPGESGWLLRTDIRLDDWRSVSLLVDSLRRVPGARDVRVESQQRENEGVQLSLSVKGEWR